MPRHLPSIQILQSIKPLQYPHNRKPSQRQRMLLTQTDPRSTIERQKLPARFPTNPALGLEFFDVRAPDVRSVVHHVDGVVDFCAFGDVDGGFLVGAAAKRECGVAGGAAGVEGDGGLESGGVSWGWSWGRVGEGRVGEGRVGEGRST